MPFPPVYTNHRLVRTWYSSVHTEVEGHIHSRRRGQRYWVSAREGKVPDAAAVRGLGATEDPQPSRGDPRGGGRARGQGLVGLEPQRKALISLEVAMYSRFYFSF